MCPELQKLLRCFELETISENRYMGEPYSMGLAHLFGGHIVAQGLMAASSNVGDKRPHSLFANFLHVGYPDREIEYHVNIFRGEGGCHQKRIVAKQGARTLAEIMASFHKTEVGINRQCSNPIAPNPDTLVSSDMLRSRAAAGSPKKYRKMLTQKRPLDIRFDKQQDWLCPKIQKGNRKAWIRPKCKIPDDSILPFVMLAYISDFGLIETSLLPHGLSRLKHKVKMASLDHTVWFHRTPDINSWILYDMQSPVSAGARAFAQGRLYSTSGVLYASVMQEGMFRAG